MGFFPPQPERCFLQESALENSKDSFKLPPPHPTPPLPGSEPICVSRSSLYVEVLFCEAAECCLLEHTLTVNPVMKPLFDGCYLGFLMARYGQAERLSVRELGRPRQGHERPSREKCILTQISILLKCDLWCLSFHCSWVRDVGNILAMLEAYVILTAGTELILFFPHQQKEQSF